MSVWVGLHVPPDKRPSKREFDALSLSPRGGRSIAAVQQHRASEHRILHQGPHPIRWVARAARRCIDHSLAATRTRRARQSSIRALLFTLLNSRGSSPEQQEAVSERTRPRRADADPCAAGGARRGGAEQQEMRGADRWAGQGSPVYRYSVMALWFLALPSGAGVSTESNIPDYRGPGGAYTTGFKPMTHQQFMSGPENRARYRDSAPLSTSS